METLLEPHSSLLIEQSKEQGEKKISVMEATTYNATGAEGIMIAPPRGKDWLCVGCEFAGDGDLAFTLSYLPFFRSGTSREAAQILPFAGLGSPSFRHPRRTPASPRTCSRASNVCG
jgi:hypothetical protein